MPPTYQPPVPFAAGVSVPPGPGGISGGTQVIDVVVTTAQILALNTTPVTLIAAPPTGFFIAPDQVFIRYNFGGVAFAGAVGALQILIGTTVMAPVPVTFSTANIGAAASSIEELALITPTGGAAPATTTLAAQAMTLKLSSANATTGTGTLHLTIYYNIEPTT